MCSSLSQANQSTTPRRPSAVLIARQQSAALPALLFRPEIQLRHLRRSDRLVPAVQEAAPAADDCRGHAVHDAGFGRRASLAADLHLRHCRRPWAGTHATRIRPVGLRTPADGSPPVRQYWDREILAARARECLRPACRLAFRPVCAACCGRVSICACCSCNMLS